MTINFKSKQKRSEKQNTFGSHFVVSSFATVHKNLIHLIYPKSIDNNKKISKCQANY